MLVLEGALAQLQRLGLINCLRHNETLKFASQLYGLLEIASEDWKLYGAEVSALSDRIRVLQSEQDALQEQISLARAYLAPVRRLPVEILLEIFEFACCEGFGLYGTTLSQELPDVLSISSVCTSWRKAAIRTPSLWAGLIATSIARHPVTRMDRPRRLHAQFIQTLYGRTRGIKLTIPLLNDKATLDFFQPFLPQADCCLALYPQGYAQLLQFLNAMPNLRELKLDMQCSPIELKLSEREIPSLVHLRKVEVSEKLGLPWAQLTELTLSWMTAATASSILPHCSAIEHLSLNFIMYEENDYHHLPITLPKLRSLSLMLSSNQQQSYALDGLRIPGLASIALYESLSEIHRSLDIPNSIPSLLKRSQAHYPLIRFLFIPPVFWHFFEKCRHLLDLSISSVSVSMTIMVRQSIMRIRANILCELFT